MKIKRILTQPELAIFTFAIAISRLLTIAAFPNPSVQPDSGSYASNSSFDFSLVSFLGNSVRSWPTPLLFSILPSNSLKMLGLVFISIASWIFLAYAVITPELSKIKKSCLLLFLIVFATNPSLVQWETVLLGQSLMISNVLCIIATLFLLVRKPASKRFIFLGIIFSILLYIQKSSNLIFTIFALVVIIAISWTLISTRLKISSLALTFVLLGYSTFVSVNVDRYWGDITYSGKTILWHLGGQSPDAAAFKSYLQAKTQAPKCLYESAPFGNIDKGISDITNGCQESFGYLSSDIQFDFAKFLIQSPTSFVKLLAIGFGASYSDSSSHYGKAIGILPSSVYSLVSGSVTPDFRLANTQDQIQAFNLIKTGEPLWIFVPGLLWISLAFGTFIFRRRNSNFAKQEFLFLAIVLGLLLQTTVTFTILPSEWVRASAPFVPISVLLSLVFLIRNHSIWPRSTEH